MSFSLPAEALSGTMFLDQLEIKVQGGNGGDGSKSFRREKYVPRGGPDGGDGGNGGNVVLVPHSGVNTLHDLASRPFYRAEHGANGGGNRKTGHNGSDVLLNVPLGTVAFEVDRDDFMGEVLGLETRLVIANGGHGGKGNVHFATPTNRAPEKTTPGVPGECLRVRLELKIVADVGLAGFPNAGKSTLIRALTRAHAKVAEYPFTTIHPVLGTMQLSDCNSLIIADIPGLIEGAHTGSGMGLDFLRHIERTRLLVYVIDINGRYDEDALFAWRTLRDEIRHYDEGILNRPCLVALNKCDLLTPEEAEETASLFCQESHMNPDDCLIVSGLEKTGLDELKLRIEKMYYELK
jgi:GTPase